MNISITYHIVDNLLVKISETDFICIRKNTRNGKYRFQLTITPPFFTRRLASRKYLGYDFLSASMNTISNGMSGWRFVIVSSAGPTMIWHLSPNPACVMFSFATYTIQDSKEITSSSV
ncbi:hypothetical protein HHX47_DHR6000564 [Lentinula edodes]|nr:hypothetical protein HHX47_DHR6000564 [Lentinula edodes]